MPAGRWKREAARKVIAAMDSSKLGQCSKRLALSPKQVALRLMDDHISEEMKQKYLGKDVSFL